MFIDTSRNKSWIFQLLYQRPTSIFFSRMSHFSLLAWEKHFFQSLRSEQQEAKTLYKQNITDYAREQLGRPLEKVSMFFDGVTQELDNGRREDEIRLLQASRGWERNNLM